jgi:hypothetical protein
VVPFVRAIALIVVQCGMGTARRAARIESGTPILTIDKRSGTHDEDRATLVPTVDERSRTLTTDERSGMLGADRARKHHRGQDDGHGGGGGGSGGGEAVNHDIVTPILSLL